MTLWQREPTLNEMLSDPLVKIVMRADRVDPDRLGQCLRAIAAQRQAPRTVQPRVLERLCA